MRLYIPGAALLLVLLVPPVWAQTGTPASQAGEPASFIGLTLEELIGRFGVPQAVYAVRGLEEWQDDVVFVYPQGDFYVFRDRVWQIGLKSAYRIRAGDPKSAVFLALGEGVSDKGDHVLCSLGGLNWPVTMRCNFDGTGNVSDIFIFRSGF
ncbi:MAG: hypothetical protein LBS48_00745 [Treponema sp.]|jgi:hypothetical protein|nr:hypothetical protein [Treponema sp.]